MVSQSTRVTHTYCRAFSSGAVTTCFYKLGVLRLGFEHPTYHLRGERSNPLRHRCGLAFIIFYDYYYLHRSEDLVSWHHLDRESGSILSGQEVM